MAIYYARANGNVNATNVWSTTAGGATSDLFPSFTSADTLMANGFTITLNVNTTVLEVRNDTTGGATAGGSFTLNNGVILTANCYGGNNVTTVSCSINSPNSASIIGNIFGGTGGSPVPAVIQTGTGTLNISGNCTGGVGNNQTAVTIGSGATCNIIGNITGGLGSAAYGVWNTGICSITGTIVGGTGLNSPGVYVTGGLTTNLTGSVTGGSTNASGSHGVHNPGTGIINITGNVTGGSLNGNVGALNSSGGTINISGTVTGGSVLSCPGVTNSSNGIINITGVSIGSGTAIGATNTSTGTLNVTRAKGNGFGNGSVGLNSVVGVSAVQTGLTRVYEIEYGDLGQSPTSGPVFLFPASSNVALFYRSGTSKKTLVDAASSSGLLPNTSDVRSGITYNAGTNVGTMAVPGAASVASGVAIDNTTGTAILTTGNIADIWNYPVSGISVSNSIGERLKNCSTVASMGQQLAAALNNVQ